MAKLVLTFGAVTVRIKHLIKAPNGSYQYKRRIPEELRPLFNDKEFFRKNLGTSDLAEASKQVQKLTLELNAKWQSLRPAMKVEGGPLTEAALSILQEIGLSPGAALEPSWADYKSDIFEDYMEKRYGDSYLAYRHQAITGANEDVDWFFRNKANPIDQEIARLVTTPSRDVLIRLSKALQSYLEEHEKGSDKKFISDATRAIEAVTKICGDLPLTSFTRQQATEVRNALLKAKRASTTVRRTLNSIVAVFNHGLKQFDLPQNNPFAELPIKGEGNDSKKRLPFNNDELIQIARGCKSKDDQPRWIVAMLLETGARAQEIIGLRKEDLSLSSQVPFIRIRENKKLGRTLKTKASEREVPLVGIALWAAKHAYEHTNDPDGWLFTNYTKNGKITAASAEATINKWIRSLGINKTSHSFRHALADRLRNEGASDELRRSIGGWSKQSIDEKYGSGHNLRRKHDILAKIAIRYDD
jgi:integrase